MPLDAEAEDLEASELRLALNSKKRETDTPRRERKTRTTTE
jgi:hypothetical protein